MPRKFFFAALLFSLFMLNCKQSQAEPKTEHALTLQIRSILVDRKPADLINFLDKEVSFGYILYQGGFRSKNGYDGLAQRKGMLYKHLFDDVYVEKSYAGYGITSFAKAFSEADKIYYCGERCKKENPSAAGFYVISPSNMLYTVHVDCPNNACKIVVFSIMPNDPFIKDPSFPVEKK